MRFLTIPWSGIPSGQAVLASSETKPQHTVSAVRSQLGFAVDEHAQRPPPLASIGANFAANVQQAHEAGKFKVHKIVGDGRCMFRATVRSLALHKGIFLRPREELEEAEQLRQACHEALCRTSSRSKDFPDARKQILYGYGDLRQYCSELARPQFWGGEVEMMVISKMLKIPIVVYTADESKQQHDQGFKVTAKFGQKYEASPKKGKKGRLPVNLLYTGGNHFDLLVGNP